MNTNASSQTQYFGFPLFAGTDKPSLLTDWNGTMEDLDTVLEDYRTRIAGCEQTTGSFMNQVNILKDKFIQVEARISADEELIQDNGLEIVALKEAMIVADTSIKRILTEITTLATKTEVQAVASSVETVSSDLATLSDHVDTLWSHITKTDSQAGSALSKSNPLAIFMYDAWDREKRYVSGDIVTHLYLDPNLNSNIVGLFKAKNEVGPVPSANENPYSDTTNWENITFVNYLFNISTFDKRIKLVKSALEDVESVAYNNRGGMADRVKAYVQHEKVEIKLTSGVEDGNYIRYDYDIPNASQIGMCPVLDSFGFVIQGSISTAQPTNEFYKIFPMDVKVKISLADGASFNSLLLWPDVEEAGEQAYTSIRTIRSIMVPEYTNSNDASDTTAGTYVSANLLRAVDFGSNYPSKIKLSVYAPKDVFGMGSSRYTLKNLTDHNTQGFDYVCKLFFKRYSA